MKTGQVFVVHAVDTEGPLYESLDHLFDRLNTRFDTDFVPSRQVLAAIRAGQYDLGDKRDAIMAFVAPAQFEANLGDWSRLDQMHETVMDMAWRQTFPDSAGNPYILSWHCMDHVGYHNNPRRRGMGYHVIFDYYRSWLKQNSVQRDGIYWHYHSPALSGDAHNMGLGYSQNLLHDEILARRIIDHQWFPSANRPGGHDETYDINCWLEAWIPFDLANQNLPGDPGWKSMIAAGMLPGQVSDWRGATDSWQPYHPDLHDFRQEGGMKRWIGRCLNINARHSNITADELDKAFVTARSGQDVMVSVTNHDFRNMAGEIEQFAHLVQDAAARHADVPFRWANTVEAFRSVLGMKKQPLAGFSISLNKDRLAIESTRPVFGNQPFLALKTRGGRYARQNMITNHNGSWVFPFWPDTIDLEDLSDIGFAANDPDGTCQVFTWNHKKDGWQHMVLNDADWIDG